MIRQFGYIVGALLFLATGLVGRTSAAPAATLHGNAGFQPTSLGYSPDVVRTAYNINPLYQQGLDGTGQTIALIEIDTINTSDLSAFDQQYNLPDPTVQEYYVGGRSFHVPVGGEATMDVEWAHAMAPGATIQLYYVRNTNSETTMWSHLARALTMARSNGATDMSISLGACGADTKTAPAQAAFASLFKAGVSVFVSSGDSGALAGPIKDCGSHPAVSYPASDPSVVAVGGTSLDVSFDGTLLNEVAWNMSGGGTEKVFPRPAWQVASTLPTRGKRWSPDVSFVGDPGTGVNVLYRGRWTTAGGTSLGAPSWAGIWALLEQRAQQSGTTLGPADPLFYKIGNSASYHTAFNDITSGTNGKYRARVGWDAVTGWGTPNVAGLESALGLTTAHK